jgi:hypothetical protein
MHADLSFSYLRFAEAASFDKKELLRSCTMIGNLKFTYERTTLINAGTIVPIISHLNSAKNNNKKTIPDSADAA